MVSLPQQRNISRANNENSVQAPAAGDLAGGPGGKSYLPPYVGNVNVGFPATIVAGPGSLPPGCYYAQPQYVRLDLSNLSATSPVFQFNPSAPVQFQGDPIIVTNLSELECDTAPTVTEFGVTPLFPGDVVWVQRIFGQIKNSTGAWVGGTIYVVSTAPDTGLIPVTLVYGSGTGGGVSGTLNTLRVNTYTMVNTITHQTLSTAQIIDCPQFCGGNVVPATHGWAIVDPRGTNVYSSGYALVQTNEYQPSRTNCAA